MSDDAILCNVPKRKKLASVKRPKISEFGSAPFELSADDIAACLELAREKTMSINVFVDHVYQYKYRVFCDMLVSTVLADIKKTNQVFCMFADNMHNTRVLLLEHLLCSQLKEIFSSDLVGIVNIYFSSAAAFTIM